MIIFRHHAVTSIYLWIQCFHHIHNSCNTNHPSQQIVYPLTFWSPSGERSVCLGGDDRRSKTNRFVFIKGYKLFIHFIVFLTLVPKTSRVGLTLRFYADEADIVMKWLIIFFQGSSYQYQIIWKPVTAQTKRPFSGPRHPPKRVYLKPTGTVNLFFFFSLLWQFTKCN